MMPAKGSIALIGFMGAGKSRIGDALGARLGLPVADTDALIVARFGAIAELFAERGETWFREQERDVCVATLTDALEQPCVVALGGGAVTNADVRAALARCAHVVWLIAPMTVLFSRAAQLGRGSGVAAARPLAQDETAFRRLHDEREPLYRECATAIVTNDGTRSVDTLVDEVIDACATDRRMAGGS
jgi:shikimate kinase